jgi:hypothetical protein
MTGGPGERPELIGHRRDRDGPRAGAALRPGEVEGAAGVDAWVKVLEHLGVANLVLPVRVV